MEEVIKRLIKWAKGDKAPPETVQIYPTNKCNLRCIFCFQQLQAYDLSDRVPDKRWLDISEELCQMGVKKILISGGGEPLAEPITIEMMKIFKKYDLEGRMIHNGMLWTENSIRGIIDVSWNNLIFSIDGPNSEIHDYLRGVRGSFDQIIANIHLFNKIKKDMKKEKPVLETTTVLCNKNFEFVSEMIKLANDLNIHHMTFEPVCINNPDVEKLRLSQDQRIQFMENIIPKALSLAEKFGIHTNLKNLLEVKYIEKAGELKDVILHDKKCKGDFFDSPCFEPWIWPKIEANGEVWPCSTTPLKENIREKSFSDIWFGDVFNKFRSNILNGILSDSCSNCVTTHIPLNKEISRKLREALRK